jgi:hypothetical protein
MKLERPQMSSEIQSHATHYQYYINITHIANGLEVRGFKPSRRDGCLTAIKIRSTPSFGGEVKTEIPCRKILRYVKTNFEV